MADSPQTKAIRWPALMNTSSFLPCTNTDFSPTRLALAAVDVIDASSLARMFVAPVKECEMTSPADTVVICPPVLTWVTMPFFTSWVYCAPVVTVIGP